MTKVFLETSLFIRYFTQDDRKKFQECLKLIQSIEKGKFRPYTSNIVLFEILFVLSRVYRFSKKESLEAIEKILSLRNLTLIEKTESTKAIKLFKKYNIKYPDCLIATQIPPSAKIVTYDEDFEKIPGILTAKPEDF